MRLVGKLVIKCKNCGLKDIIDVDSLCEEVYSIGEFGMGDRFEHSFEDEIQCARCASTLWFKVFCFEYPVGMIEYQDSDSQGCEFVNEPTIEKDIEFDIPFEYEEWLADEVEVLLDQIRDDPSLVHRISDRQFEEVVAEAFRQKGYEVELTPPKKDGGKDVIAYQKTNGIEICLYIECKHYGPNDPVGVGIIRAVSGVRNHDRVNKAIVITTSRFTRIAKEFAAEEKHLVQLWGLKDFYDLIKKEI